MMGRNQYGSCIQAGWKRDVSHWKRASQRGAARPPRHGAVSGGQMAGHSVLFTTQKCRWIRPVIRTTRDRAGGRKNYLAMEQICVSQIVPILF